MISAAESGGQSSGQQETGPNKISGANAGGPRQFPMRTRWAARVAQFWRWAEPLSDFGHRRSNTVKCGF
jgi:hypothetical protein